jgi:sulfate adenylyltransferase large subunit
MEAASENELIEKDILGYLQKHESKELLRFVIVGSVDDGKSTLIGRLLHDINAVYEDQLQAVKRASSMEGANIDFSLFTDGLAAEREQGITIDVAYRYFTTEKRKFIVADTPGHVQYTRNMVTGASTADVGVILIDARLGVLEQSRRHAYIASLLGIPHLLVAINKMDLREYSEGVFQPIVDELRRFVAGLHFKDVTFVPVSAMHGENVVTRSSHMPWYRGPTVLELLEQVQIADDRNLRDFRFPVQYVLRPNLNYRGFSGQIASGVVKTDDEVMVLPSGRVTRIKSIDTFEGARAEAFAPESVTLRLKDEVDCSRGDLIVHPHNRPRLRRRVEADVVWLHERPLDPQKSYLLKHTSRMVRMEVDQVQWKVDLQTLQQVEAESLQLNDIGRLSLTCHQPLYCDAYTSNRATGAFVIVDSLTNNTVGAGMIVDDAGAQDLETAGGNEHTQVSPRERADKLGQRGVTVHLDGASAKGLAFALERRLFDLGHAAYVLPLDGEPERALALAVRACTEAGLVTICFGGDAAAVCAVVGEARFVAAVATAAVDEVVEEIVASLVARQLI